MRRYFTALLAIALLAHPAQAARALPQAKLIAVYFYADWCPNCKALSPIMGEVRSDAGLQQEPVLFVTLDLTDKPRIRQALLLSTALGMGNYVRAQGSATGYVALLDAATKQELARFDRTDTAAGILTTMRTKLAQ